MRTSGWLAVAALVLGGLAMAGPDTPANVTPEQVQVLIARLGSGQFREREAATRELDAIGPAALDALRLAAQSGDSETRRRATELVERINLRLTTARVLTPNIVRFDYTNKPLAAAVADLAKLSGAPITLHDPERFQSRNVTVSAGPLPFWQALEQFCQKAGLHEWDGLSQLPPGGPNAGLTGRTTGMAQVQMQVQVQVQGQIFIRQDRGGLNSPYAHQQIVLLDGPEPARPAHHAGAVRVRALPAGTPFPLPAVSDGGIVLPLHVSAEPRLGSAGALDIRIHKAIDDEGQNLTATAVRPTLANEFEEVFFFAANGILISQEPLFRAGPIGVRLTRGEKVSKTLRELTGVVTAQVRVTELMATLDASTAAIGQTFTSDQGAVLKVVDVSRQADEYRLTLQVQLPNGIGLVDQNVGQLETIAGLMQPLNNGINQGGRRGGRNGGPRQTPTLPAGTKAFHGLSLEDAQGQRINATKGSLTLLAQTPQETHGLLEVVFRPEKGVEPKRLAFAAARPIAIEVPFTLKDVPLP